MSKGDMFRATSRPVMVACPEGTCPLYGKEQSLRKRNKCI